MAEADDAAAPSAARRVAKKAPGGRVTTGVSNLDLALGGGLRPGASALFTGEPGAGATELALTLAAAQKNAGREARVITALRSPKRLRAEGEALVGKGVWGGVPVEAWSEKTDAVAAALEDLGPGGVVVIESAGSLARIVGGMDFLFAARAWSDAAAAARSNLVFTGVAGTLTPGVDASFWETMDVVLQFQWLGERVRRRVLRFGQMRGLSPAVEGEEVAVLEVSLRGGSGFEVSPIRGVM